jgi:hypothetical protein
MMRHDSADNDSADNDSSENDSSENDASHDGSPHGTAPEAANPPGGNVRPLRTAAAVIYVTLCLLAIAIPQSLVNRVRDIDSTAVEEALLPAAEALQKSSQRAGLTVPYRRARALFLALAGKEEN